MKTGITAKFFSRPKISLRLFFCIGITTVDSCIKNTGRIYPISQQQTENNDVMAYQFS